jgi:hypothetical protein
MSSPELKPNKIADDEVNNKCSIEFNLRIIAEGGSNADCYSVRQHSSKPMLGVCFFSSLL